MHSLFAAIPAEVDRQLHRRLGLARQSGSGAPVRSSAGLTFAAIPKSIIHTSPLLALGIFLLHAVEHLRAFECGLIAEGGIPVLFCEFEQLLPNRSPFGFG